KERRSSADDVPVTTLGEPSALPDNVGQVRGKGPKFVFELALKPPESLVWSVEDRVGEDNRSRPRAWTAYFANTQEGVGRET
ncbi:hypothetical protein HPB47_007203, partial [Ixodes persulcatus]